MYYKLKIFLFFCLILINYHSISQVQKNDSRELEDIRLIMNNIFNNKIYTRNFYFEEVTHELPSYFTSYSDCFKIFKNEFLFTDFVENKLFNLNKKDCDQLNYSIINDTAKVYIKKDWFTGVKVKILSESVTQYKTNSYTKYTKPIFFRNNTRCFIVIYHSNYLNSFFLKKKYNNWVLDRPFIISVDD
jgi:hypothetical protein